METEYIINTHLIFCQFSDAKWLFLVAFYLSNKFLSSTSRLKKVTVRPITLSITLLWRWKVTQKVTLSTLNRHWWAITSLWRWKVTLTKRDLSRIAVTGLLKEIKGNNVIENVIEIVIDNVIEIVIDCDIIDIKSCDNDVTMLPLFIRYCLTHHHVMIVTKR